MFLTGCPTKHDSLWIIFNFFHTLQFISVKKTSFSQTYFTIIWMPFLRENCTSQEIDFSAGIEISSSLENTLKSKFPVTLAVLPGKSSLIVKQIVILSFWHDFLLLFITFYCFLLHFIAFYCISLHFIVFYRILLRFIACYCILLHFIAFYCFLLLFIAFYCILLFFIAF